MDYHGHSMTLLNILVDKVPKFHLGTFSEFSKSSQVHKKGLKRAYKTRFDTKFPSSQSSQPLQGGGVSIGGEIFPSFTIFKFDE